MSERIRYDSTRQQPAHTCRDCGKTLNPLNAAEHMRKLCMRCFAAEDGLQTEKDGGRS